MCLKVNKDIFASTKKYLYLQFRFHGGKLCLFSTYFYLYVTKQLCTNTQSITNIERIHNSDHEFFFIHNSGTYNT